ncbi:MAG: 16S rRNA (cytosine(967)-C(5))-methyltransferase RsmB [Lachnospiraceae bacterium]|nr:16S rRNA (cytosine(967)-C(5))-methyltransferase RsmB [Lachnospiraceae bacterium]
MSDVVNIRKLSAELTYLILEDNEFENVVLDGLQIKYAFLSESDRHFIVRLVKGTVERKLELDFYINSLSKTPVRKMKKWVRTILRNAIYQIRYMDSSKDYAVVNEAVKLVKAFKYPQFRGFVNGVLRNYIREMDNLTPNTLEAKYSVPQWIIDSFENELGKEDTIKTLDAFLKQSPLTIRLNTFKGNPEDILKEIQEEGFGVEEVDSGFNIYNLKNIDSLSKSKALLDGKFYIQDYSSMKPVMLAGIKNGMKVLDVCAAPGGKTIMASECTKDGQVVSCDISSKKTDIIKENAKRMGASNIDVRINDATVFNEDFENAFDIIILDVPCSGLGVIGRKADLRYRVKKEDLLSLQTIQRQIIDNAKRYVRNGGRIIFSTCTIDKLENEDNKDYILKTCPNLKLISEEKILPFNYGSDGFYIAVFESKN